MPQSSRVIVTCAACLRQRARSGAVARSGGRAPDGSPRGGHGSSGQSGCSAQDAAPAQPFVLRVVHELVHLSRGSKGPCGVYTICAVVGRPPFGQGTARSSPPPGPLGDQLAPSEYHSLWPHGNRDQKTDPPAAIFEMTGRPPYPCQPRSDPSGSFSCQLAAATRFAAGDRE